MARKSKYTPQAVARIVEAVELGATYELAAQCGGISYDTFNEWMKGKPEFHADIKAAEGQSAFVALQRVRKAAEMGEWQAAAWLLERRHGYVKPSETLPGGGGLTLRIEWTRDWRAIGSGVEQVRALPVLELPELPGTELPAVTDVG